MEIRSEYGGNQHGEEMEPEENLEDLEKRDRKNMFSEKDVNGAKEVDFWFLKGFFLFSYYFIQALPHVPI